MAHAINPDPDDDGSCAVPLDEDPGKLGTIEEQVVRPFDPEVSLGRTSHLHDGIVDRKSCHKGQLGTSRLRRRIGEKKARKEITGV